MSEVVFRTFDIMECLAGEPGGLSLGEICKRLDVPKALGHRALRQLIERGYVEQDTDTRDYKLTFQLAMLGFRYIVSTGVYDVLTPILDQVGTKTGEYVTLGAVDGDNLIWIANTYTATGVVRCEPYLGPVINLHATACGLCWLASLTEDRAVDIILRRGFESISPQAKNAPRSISEFLKALSITRDRGYGLSLESAEPGLNAISMAFKSGQSASGSVVGTLSIAGPAFRLDEERLLSFLPILRNATKEIGALWPMRATRQPNADSATSRERLWNSRKSRSRRGSQPGDSDLLGGGGRV